MRRVYYFIAVPEVFLPPEVLNEAAYPRAVGMPQHQAGACAFIYRKEVKFPAELPVVAFFGLLKHSEVFVEFALLCISRTVYALQHLVTLVAAPVGTRHR